MASIYLEDAQNALEAIKANGTSMQLVKIVQGAINIATDTTTNDVVTSYPCYGVIAPPKGGKGAGSDFIDSKTLDRRHEQRFIIAALSLPKDVQPLPNDTIIVSGNKWRILVCNTINPDGTQMIFHDCQVSR